MSKIRVIRKDVSHTYNITENSSNDTYVVWERAIEGNSKIHLNFNTANNYFRKSGNDLLIYSVYSNSKIVTTTVQDYYKYNVYDFLRVSFGDKLNQGREQIDTFVVAENKIAGYITDTIADDVIFGTKGKNKFSIFNGGKDKIYDVEGDDTYQLSASSDDSASTTIIDFKGNDKYNLYNLANATITENKGNDTYKANGMANVTVTDKKGNDKYNFSNLGSLMLTDNDGNDSYSLSNDVTFFASIIDKKGNDKYAFNNSFVRTISSALNPIDVTDKDGNDKYTITKSIVNIVDELGSDTYSLNSSSSSVIDDKSGKDNYTVSNSNNVTIVDKAGKDNYKLSYADYFYVTDGIQNDTKGGNDTYSIKHSYGNYVFSQTNPDPEVNIVDYYGKENYSISYSDRVAVEDLQGSDSYKIKYSSDISIQDKDNTSTLSSNDKYEVTESNNSNITDYSGNDDYALTSSNGTIIDKLGNDNYNVKEVPVNMIAGSDNNRTSIKDEKGNDKYNFTNAYAQVTDNSGTDKYIISNSDIHISDKASSSDNYTIKKLNSKVAINDEGGTADKLNLSGASKAKLVYMANYDLSTTSNTDVKDGSLYIFDRTKSGFVKIENFLNTSGGNIASGNGKGYIENIKAGLFSINNAIDNYTTSSTNIGILGQAVAQWQSPSETDYASVDAILNSNNANDIASFITYVQTKC